MSPSMGEPDVVVNLAPPRFNVIGQGWGRSAGRQPG